MAHLQNNLLLDSLSPKNRMRLISLSKEVSMPIKTWLQEQEEVPAYGYFLTSGIASVVIALAEGGTTEVAIIGREGLVNSLSLLGPSVPPSQCFIQMTATGYRIPFASLKEAFLDTEETRMRILENVQQQSMTMGQIAACNKLHEAEPRLARWLLMVQDRVQEDVLHLTQEFLAEMLGSRRTTVALAAGSLQRSGCIDYQRGKIKIISREELQNVACDCYPTTKRLFLNLYN